MQQQQHSGKEAENWASRSCTGSVLDSACTFFFVGLYLRPPWWGKRTSGFLLLWLGQVGLLVVVFGFWSLFFSWSGWFLLVFSVGMVPGAFLAFHYWSILWYVFKNMLPSQQWHVGPRWGLHGRQMWAPLWACTRDPHWGQPWKPRRTKSGTCKGTAWVLIGQFMSDPFGPHQSEGV